MRFPIEVLPKFLGQTAVGFAMLTLVIYCIRTNKSGRQTEFVCSHWRIYKVRPFSHHPVKLEQRKPEHIKKHHHALPSPPPLPLCPTCSSPTNGITRGHKGVQHGRAWCLPKLLRQVSHQPWTIPGLAWTADTSSVPAFLSKAQFFF